MEKVEKQNKLSYEDLQNAAHQLAEQNRNFQMENNKLRKALEGVELMNFYKRLDYLLVVIQANENAPFSTGFRAKCAQEFETLMLAPEEEQQKEEK